MQLLSMPSGSLVQIVAQGSQDIFLTSIPEITFFKSVYNRHTNFAVESVAVPFNGQPDFDRQIITALPKHGDLLHKIWLKIQMPAVNLVATDTFIDSAEVTDLQNKIANAESLAAKYKEFFRYNYIILNCLRLEILSIGGDWFTVQTLMANKKTSYISTINTVGVALDDVISEFYSTFPSSVKNNYIGSDENAEKFLTDVQAFIDRMKRYYNDEEKTLLDSINDMKDGLANITTTNEYFAWSL